MPASCACSSAGQNSARGMRARFISVVPPRCGTEFSLPEKRTAPNGAVAYCSLRFYLLRLVRHPHIADATRNIVHDRVEADDAAVLAHRRILVQHVVKADRER